ncbi:MAG: T9SS type A sorting domain-containing protein [Bacteroidota bacterium]
MHTTTFEWSVPEPASIIGGQGTNAISVDWGEANGNVSVAVSNECIDEQIQRKILNPDGQYPYPDPYQPHTLPGNIEAIHYDYGGEGVAYHDLESTNQGNGPRQDNGVDTEYSEPNGNVGWIEAGEWLEYSIEVQDTSFVETSFRTASSGGGGPLSVLINGKEKITDVMINDTEGWGNFTTQNIGSFLITPEDTLLRIEAEGGGFNLGRMQFKEGEATDLEKVSETADLRIYPNPVENRIVIEGHEPIISVEIINLLGVKMKHKNLSRETKQHELNLSDLESGMYIIRVKTKSSKFFSKQFLKK